MMAITIINKDYVCGVSPVLYINCCKKISEDTPCIFVYILWLPPSTVY